MKIRTNIDTSENTKKYDNTNENQAQIQRQIQIRCATTSAADTHWKIPLKSTQM